MKTTRAHALAALLTATLLGGVALADTPITDEAKRHFGAGVNLLKDPEGARYEDAYREFKAAYAASPSYKILGNLGLTAMKLERDGEAIEAYTKYLAEGRDLDPAEKKQIETDLATLKAGVARVTVQVNVDGVTLRDQRVPSRGDAVNNQYGPVKGSIELGLRPGHHVMIARAAGYDDQAWEFDVAPSAKETHTFTLTKKGGAVVAPPPATASAAPSTTSAPPPPPPKERIRPVPTSVYVAGGAAAVLLAGGAVTGMMALGKKSDFDKKNDGSDPDGAKSLRDSGKSLNLVADVMLIGGLAAGGLAAYLYSSRPEQEVATGAPRRALPRFTLVPAASPAGGGVVASGSF
ncbi:MAG: hypothetical protein IT374_12730 [Polyangiaceae bacterium]|nr:hypothetical protein [Polyangiaceae bacterium]